MSRICTRALVFAFAALLPAVALAWSDTAEFGASAHAHRFERAKLENSGCVIHYRLWFDAPAEAYANPNKAHYQFRARVRLQSGKEILSPIFSNHGPGKRVYEHDYDTGTEGCFAQDPQKIAGVDVQACRGTGCTPRAFE